MLPYAVRGAVWVILYLFFILAPLFALLAGILPPTHDFWREFSVAIGYAGLAMAPHLKSAGELALLAQAPFDAIVHHPPRFGRSIASHCASSFANSSARCAAPPSPPSTASRPRWQKGSKGSYSPITCIR